VRKTGVKPGLVCDGWRKAGRNRYQTVNKAFVGDTGPGGCHRASVVLRLRRHYDLASIKDIILGGDGASRIKEGAEYPGARFQLSRYHLNRGCARRLAIGARPSALSGKPASAAMPALPLPL